MAADDRIKAFKDVARNYTGYKEHVKSIDDKLLVIQNRMENVHSIEFDKPAGSVFFAENPLLELIEKKTAYEQEKQYYSDLIKWMDDLVDGFDSGAIKALIWMSCIQKKSLSSIAEKYNMSKDYLYKVRRHYLMKALSDDRMEKLDRIQRSSPIQVND